MNKVIAYQTGDGQVFISLDEAMQHENKVLRESKIRKWVSTYCLNGATLQDIAETLIEFGEELGI